MGRFRKRDLIWEFFTLLFGKGKKAAPRFELGIKDLQSSALPLGHAATEEIVFSSSDRISRTGGVLLVISNGHGEDLIAMRVMEALHCLHPSLVIEVLPLVGEGKIFDSAVSKGWVRRVARDKPLPSGGFSNQSISALIFDLSAGLLGTAWKNLQLVRKAAHRGRVILAVGDILPLFFAWLSRTSFVFIGTPKSDYTWMSGPGYSLSDFYHSLKGSEWDPWEYFLMRSFRCKFVAVRDNLTARGLRRHRVNAYAPGNPMMDCFKSVPIPFPEELKDFTPLLLLCGSRIPEAIRNFQRLIQASEILGNDVQLAIFVALSAEPSAEKIQTCLEELNYEKKSLAFEISGSESCWSKGSNLVFVGPDQFFHWATWAHVGLANAGTATEQLVGLGIPAISLPGKGPQFQKDFAFRQSRLLGGSVISCKTPLVFAKRLEVLLADELTRQKLGNLGKRRMGPKGGSDALAKMISTRLLIFDQVNTNHESNCSSDTLH